MTLTMDCLMFRLFCVPLLVSALISSGSGPLLALSAPSDFNYTELHRLNDPTPTSSDGFGYSVAIDANRIIVGARTDETKGTNVGQATLFNAASGTPLHTFDDPTLAYNSRGKVIGEDLFGSSVSISGGKVLIGAPGDRTSGIGVGQAHAFEANGSLLYTFDDPTPTSSDRFGTSVSLSNDYAIVGAPFDDTIGLDTGQVHAFNIITGLIHWTVDDPTITGEDWFGYSTAIKGDFVLVGDPRDNTSGSRSGQAHLFSAETGELIRTFENPVPNSQSEFGWSVALDNGYAVIGAPRHVQSGFSTGLAYVLDIETGDLLHTLSAPVPVSEGIFGWSIAIDNELVAIGALGPAPGQVYLFDAVSGEYIQTLYDPTDTSGDGFRDSFGSSVAVDSVLVAVGAPRDDTLGFSIGQAHVYYQIPEPTSVAILLELVLVLSVSGVLESRDRKRCQEPFNFSAAARCGWPMP